MKGRLCELCHEQAVVYCESDSAFLCCNCDSRVHQTNFLVARHIRRTLCSTCKEFTGYIISGGKLDWKLSRTCTSCMHDVHAGSYSPSSSSSSSTCVSSTTSVGASCPKMKTARLDLNSTARSTNCTTLLDKKAQDIFKSWCSKLGFNSTLIVPLASTAFGLSLRSGTSSKLPFRLRLAASFWLALRLCKGNIGTWKNLKDVEMLSHVPGKFILAAETKVAIVLRDMKKRESGDLAEGWAESCT